LAYFLFLFLYIFSFAPSCWLAGQGWENKKLFWWVPCEWFFCCVVMGTVWVIFCCVVMGTVWVRNSWERVSEKLCVAVVNYFTCNCTKKSVVNYLTCICEWEIVCWLVWYEWVRLVQKKWHFFFIQKLSHTVSEISTKKWTSVWEFCIINFNIMSQVEYSQHRTVAEYVRVLYY
jgi:hypothetical protein